ncbi:MAG: hypothetical protein QOD56_3201, partial [Gammaproteobacteria bacterium]|nr:hypothetical protein [Gammaproteobacteria bacterium]
SINTDPVAAGRFEIPADWTKEAPKTTRTTDDEYTCPKT